MRYLILAFVMTLCGCHKDETPTPSFLAIISYVDSSGNDLFADGSNGYIADSVRLYYYQDGVKTLVNTARPGVISTFLWGVIPLPDHNNPNAYAGLGIETNFGIVKDSSTIFIHLKAGVEDTLACKFIEDNYVLYLAWYNGVPKMTAAGKQNPFFTVVK